jgi:hypothetical protein
MWSRARPRPEFGAQHSRCRAQESSLRARERVNADHHPHRARQTRLREIRNRDVVCDGMNSADFATGFAQDECSDSRAERELDSINLPSVGSATLGVAELCDRRQFSYSAVSP